MTTPLPLPPEDRDRSPLTGWTRDHWAALADRMLLAIEPLSLPGGGDRRPTRPRQP